MVENKYNLNEKGRKITTTINSVVLAISKLSRGLEGEEKEKTACVSGFFNVVVPSGIKPPFKV